MLFSGGRGPELFFWRNPECLHFSVEIATLQPEQFGSARYVATRFFKLAQNVVTFGRLLHVVKAAKDFRWFAILSPAGAIERKMPHLNSALRIQNNDTLH